MQRGQAHRMVGALASSFLAWSCSTSGGALCGPGSAPRGESCISVPEKPKPFLICGVGTHFVHGSCVAIERSADGGSDAGSRPGSTPDASRDSGADVSIGPDREPPVFAGAISASGVSDSVIRVSWHAASDDRTPQSSVVYRLFASKARGAEDYAAATAVSAPGATTALVGGLEQAPREYFFVVRARDEAGNEDDNTVEVNATAKSEPAAPVPVFEGCAAAVEGGPSEIDVSWLAATDETTPANQIEYRVWTGDSDEAARAHVGGTPVVVTGGLHASVKNIARGSRYFFYCEAVDSSGNPDGNTHTVSLLFDDPPKWPLAFVGVSALGTTAATVSWSPPATDDVTPSSELVYVLDISDGVTTSEVESAPGASDHTLTDLQPDVSYTATVHARDGAGQLDSGNAFVDFSTVASYSVNIQPKFDAECATAGCHDATAAGGLVLSAGKSYGALVGKMAQGPLKSQGVSWPLVDTSIPGNSYLHLKITDQGPGVVVGSRMPIAPDGGFAPLDGDLARFVLDWAQASAPNN